MKPTPCALGIDVGGSSIKSACVDINGNLFDYSEHKTRHDQELVQQLHPIIDHYLHAPSCTIQGISLGIPGHIDPVHAYVRTLALQLPPLDNPNIGHTLRLHYQKPLLVDNDVNNALTGERLFGAARLEPNLFMMTIGTGIGGALVLDGQIVRGATNHVGEIGHCILVPQGRLCRCGQRGCFEAYASASALVEQFREACGEGESSSVHDSVELDARAIIHAAAQGDTLCHALVQKAYHSLITICVNILHLLNVSKILLGGGCALVHSFDDLNAQVRANVLPSLRGHFEILPATLGNRAGVLGAASLLRTP